MSGGGTSGFKGRAGIAGKVLVGLVLVVVIMILVSGLRDHDAGVGFMDPEASIDARSEAASDSAESGSASIPSSTTTTLTALEAAEAGGGFLAARTAVDRLRVYDKVPPGSQLIHSFDREDELGIIRTFLIDEEAVDNEGRHWYRVYLPVRPNGSKGWLRAGEVEDIPLQHHVRVSLGDHRLDLFEGEEKLASYPVGVGKAGTTTPTGLYYVTEKIRPSNTAGPYGELAIGISAFSEELTDWPGGGQVGIHGTNDNSTIGTDVSNGCIRLYNEDILEATESMPLGTPVFIDE